MAQFPGFRFARRLCSIPTSGLWLLLALTALPVPAADPHKESAPAKIQPIAPAASTGTGLLLQPPLDLNWYTRAKFVEQSSSIGTNRIGRKWTNPVVPLPPHPRADAKRLTEDEVKTYMTEARRLFEAGECFPVSDVGLISTQEDVVRQPMLNHIAAFSNSVARVYLLVQKTATDKGWSFFSIVQDLSVAPALDYYAELKKSGPKFDGNSCYKCHSSGPLAIHPAREDLVLDAALAAAVSQHIATQPRSVPQFPKDSPMPPQGKVLTLKFCARCHAADPESDRDALYQVQSHPIRILVDFGYMPPNRRLKPEEIAELKAWLEKKP
jgi:mono/diheme cytochrome c family protein